MSSQIGSGPVQSHLKAIQKRIKKTEDYHKALLVASMTGEKIPANKIKAEATKTIADQCQLDIGGPIDRIERVLRWARKYLDDENNMRLFMKSSKTVKNGDKLVASFRGKA